MSTTSPRRRLRVGTGFDVHAFAENRPLILGGIQIPHTHGLAGHSDADVLVHAIIDSLLGAAGMGDIGQLFPDTSAQWHNADSCNLLKLANERLKNAGWSIINIDSTIIAQAPKILPFVEAMKTKLAQILEIPVEDIHIKGKTTEKLGFVGRAEGIAAQAVALIEA